VLRGGSSDGNKKSLRCAFRYLNMPVNRHSLIGFRVVMSPTCESSVGFSVRRVEQVDQDKSHDRASKMENTSPTQTVCWLLNVSTKVKGLFGVKFVNGGEF
jgi:hypothetical protein